MNVAEPFAKQARDRGEAVAIIQPSRRKERSITFGELHRRSVALANRFKRRGLMAGDRVLVMIEVSIDLYIALVALLRSGLVAVFLDPSAGRAHVRQCCETAPPTAVLGPIRTQLLRLAFPGIRRAKSLIYPNLIRGTASGDPAEAPAPCTPESPALLTFTSGSTAVPKAAVRTHGLLSAQQSALAEAIDLQNGQIDLATLPVFVLANLAAGVTTVLADADLKRPGFIEAQPVIDQIHRHRITRTTGSPAFYTRLAEHCEQTGQTLEPLKQLYTGGAPVFHDLLIRLNQLMPNGSPTIVYGSTEAEPIAHVGYDAITPDDISAMKNGKGLLVGRPVRQIELCIADPEHLRTTSITAEQFEAARCNMGEPGEILVTGDHVLKGYVNPSDDSETKLRVDHTIWHRSGDMGMLDPSGRLWLLGRSSAVIRDDRGVLFPFAIESSARQVDGVQQAAVLAMGSRRILAVEAAASVDATHVRSKLEQRFVGVIDEVVLLSNIPLDTRHNAKVRYPALRQMIEQTRMVK